MSPYYKGFCVEQSTKNLIFAKCLQVFKMFGRVGGLKYLCSVKDCASRAQDVRILSLSCHGKANHQE